MPWELDVIQSRRDGWLLRAGQWGPLRASGRGGEEAGGLPREEAGARPGEDGAFPGLCLLPGKEAEPHLSVTGRRRCGGAMTPPGRRGPSRGAQGPGRVYFTLQLSRSP